MLWYSWENNMRALLLMVATVYIHKSRLSRKTGKCHRCNCQHFPSSMVTNLHRLQLWNTCRSLDPSDQSCFAGGPDSCQKTLKTCTLKLGKVQSQQLNWVFCREKPAVSSDAIQRMERFTLNKM